MAISRAYYYPSSNTVKRGYTLPPQNNIILGRTRHNPVTNLILRLVCCLSFYAFHYGHVLLIIESKADAVMRCLSIYRCIWYIHLPTYSAAIQTTADNLPMQRTDIILTMFVWDILFLAVKGKANFISRVTASNEGKLPIYLCAFHRDLNVYMYLNQHSHLEMPG